MLAALLLGLFFLFVRNHRLVVSKLVILPWVIYFGACLFFGVYLFLDSIISLIVIVASVFFVSVSSYFGQVLGGHFHGAVVGDPNVFMPRNGALFSVFSVSLIVLGMLSGFLLVSSRVHESAEALFALDFYSLRMSISSESSLVERSALDLATRFLFSFCFLSMFFGLKDYKYFPKLRVLHFVSLVLLVIFSLSHGARLIVVYIFILVFLRSYFEGYIISKGLLIFFVLAFWFFVLMFYLRAPVSFSEAYDFYRMFFGFDDFYFLFALEIEDSVFVDLISIVGMYFVHSLDKFGDFLSDFESLGCASGVYTFSLGMRIINFLFNVSSDVGVCASDDTRGYYTTFLRDPLADFGFIGATILLSIFAFLTGFFFYFRNLGWSFRVVFYFGALAFCMAPLLSVLSGGFIALLYYVSLLVSLSKLYFYVFLVLRK